MPNTSNDDVIIVGSLSDKELRDSIDKLVDYVGDKTTIMAGKFDVAMEKMKSAMKDFAITQKVSVDLMQDAWKQMSASFDAMLKAQQNATSSGNNSGSGGGNSQYADNTVGHLQEIIALEEKRRKEMTLGSDALRDQNKLIEEQKAKLKGETTSDQVKAAQAAKKELQEAFTMPARGLADAEKKLQQLQSLSAKFQGKGILDQTQWNRLNAQIQTTQEKIDKLRQKKPTSIQDVLGMDESSVDAIAKKMAALKKVTVDPQNTAQVKQLGDEYQRLKRLQAELMGQNIQMTHSNNYLAQSFGYIRNRLVYAMTLGAITSFTKQVYEIRGQYELLERSLGVLVNSFERGSQIFQELNQMAIESPFTLMELAGAAKQLTAYNFAANEVVDTTRRLADISAALGVPMERLTYNLGQIRAQTVLTARDARDFANAGLPIVASLAEHFTELEGKIVTTGDVYDRMSKKMVSYSDVMAVLNKMTDEGGKFFEFQAKQAETLRVQMANLNLAWNNMLNDIGKSNQGLLTLPISGLKALLQNWQTIDRVLKSMLYTFIGWKALQMVAIRQQWAWATATGATAKQMGWLANGIKAVGASLKALFLNPWTWVFVGIMAVIDLVRQTNAAREAMHELNQEIRDNANEASESMLNYLNNKGNKSTLELAKQNKLTAEQGERAWESLKQQIEQSALSANGLIAELLAIEDVNERVRVGFDYAERIQKAQAALQDLKDDSIEVNTDVGWFGMFGEGLVSDLKDYADYIERYSEIARNNQIAGEAAAEWMHQVGVVKGARQEFLEELDDTAESINNFIRAYNITDPLQINEILERVRSQIKAKNPEIKGEAAKIFDISLDQKMSELTNGAVDRNASLWNMFMERLKHNSSSAFQDINDDWIKNNEALSSEQQAAVDANLQYFKDSMPYAYQAVSDMVADASKLKIHIGIAFNVQQLSDFQKEVNQRIANAPKTLDFGGGAFLPTNNDNLSSWVKTQQQAIKSLEEENEKYALDDTQWSKEKIAANDREIQQRKNLLDLFNQSYLSDTDARKGQKQHKRDVDEVSQALQSELKVIREMQSNYDKLRKSGVSNMDAIDLASRGYEATIIRINQVLSKFGIDKFNAANFAGKDVRSLLQSLEEQRQALLASGKVKTSSLQALDVEIQKLTVDAKTYDMKKVTDGLNSELGKIKDEYELAIELDANPELGGIFADMMGIDEEQLKTLPRTFNQVVSQLQASIDKLFADNNIDGSFDLTQMLDKGDFDKWVTERGNTLDDTFVKALNKIREYANKVRLDETKETIKNWNSLLEKYGDYQTKMVRVVQETTKEQVELIRKFGTAEEQAQALNLASKITLTAEPAEIARIQKQLADLITMVTRGKNVAVQVAASIDKSDKQGKAKVSWDEFKDSDMYSLMFEDMDRVSTRAIQNILAQLDKLKDKVKDDPASMKALMDAYKKGRDELESRAPFENIIVALKEMRQASIEAADARKQLDAANKEYENAQDAVNYLQSRGESGKGSGVSYTERLAKAQERLKKATEAKNKAEINAANAEIKQINSQKKFQNALNNSATCLQNVGGLLKQFAELLGIAEDSEAGEMVNALSQGFTMMATALSMVAAAAVLAEMSLGWVAAAAAALAVVVGLVSFLAGSHDRQIEREIKASELAVKRLENSYKNLEKAVEEAFGASEIAAKKAEIANKKLQLTELQRQLQLERSRDSKKRDAGKIADLEGQIIDLKNEIKDMKNDVTNSFLGISSVKDAVGSMVDDIVDALRNGEDAMGSFNDSIDDMIANMIKQVFSARILGPMLEKIWENIDDEIQGRGEVWADQLARFQSMYDHIVTNTDDTGNGYYFYKKGNSYGYTNSVLDAIALSTQEGVEMMTYGAWKAAIENILNYTQDYLDDATTPTMNDIRRYAGDLREVSPELEAYMDDLEAILREMGLIKDATSEEALSKLQQGIQGVTEDTAGAIEAYMNIVAQRVFEQNLYLQEIRDHLNNFDLDVQLGTLSQMLLQLQQSYQVQQNIESILTGVLNPSGRAIVVELNS